MDKWIRDLINSVTAGLTALINAVTDRISWVYTIFVTFFIKVRSAFDRFVSGVKAGLDSLRRMASEAYTTVRWIIYVRIPQVVSNAVNTAINYLLRQLDAAQQFLRGLIDGVLDWTLRQIRRIDAFIDGFVKGVRDTFNAITSLLNRVARLVLDLLTDPRHLAAWVIDAIIAELLRWVDRNTDRLVILLRQKSIQYTLRFIDRAEDIIVRLL